MHACTHALPSHPAALHMYSMRHAHFAGSTLSTLASTQLTCFVQVTDLEARMTMAKTEAFELQRKLESALKEVRACLIVLGGWFWRQEGIVQQGCNEE